MMNNLPNQSAEAGVLKLLNEKMKSSKDNGRCLNDKECLKRVREGLGIYASVSSEEAVGIFLISAAS